MKGTYLGHLSHGDPLYGYIQGHIHPRRTDYYGLTTGIPKRTGPREAQQDEAAPEPKAKK